MNQILENRRKWIDYLKQPERKKTTGRLQSDSEPDARCCLGHACFVLGAAYEPNQHYPRLDVTRALGLWDNKGSPDGGVLSNGMESLSHWNDNYQLNATPQQIGEYLETVIMGGAHTPFQEITE